jgi:pyridoxine 5'-phosphate synthase PdxJ
VPDAPEALTSDHGWDLESGAGHLLPIIARETSRWSLGLNAGHDLNLENLGRFCRAVPDVLEVSIGHALIRDALAMGSARPCAVMLRCWKAMGNRRRGR